jgi:superfamily II DNA/RNA helicase
MPKEIEALASQYLNKPVKVKIGRVSVPTANVAQSLERTTESQKLELLAALLQVRCRICMRVRVVELCPFTSLNGMSHIR